MKKWFLGLMAALALFASGASAEMAMDLDEKQQLPSLNAALEWLKLIDEGDYAESWENAATYLKQIIPQEQWEKSLSAARIPFEALISRRVLSNNPLTSLPGVPDGEYDVLTFESSYVKKAEAIETITVMKDTDGTWRVAGYYIK